MTRRALGTLLVCISAAAFGTYPYFAILATKEGMGTVSLLMFRFGIAAAILLCLALVTRAGFPGFRRLLPVAGLGLIYVGQAFTFLKCLEESSAIVVSLLLYIYPAWVTLGSVLFLQEKLTKAKVVALVCAFVGSFVIIGPVGGISVAAVLYGVLTSLFYATYLVAGKYVLKEHNSVVATLTIITTAGLVFGGWALATGVDVPGSTTAWIGAVGLAVVATVVAIGALLAGLERVSPVEASSLSALEPLVSAIIAITVLGQPLVVWHVFGGVLVIAAVLVLARQAASTPK